MTKNKLFLIMSTIQTHLISTTLQSTNSSTAVFNATTDISTTQQTNLTTAVMACATPSSVSFATVSVNSTHATYSCNSGYSMSGDATITCVASSWSGGYPTCSYIQPTASTDNNITVNTADRKYKTTPTPNN